MANPNLTLTTNFDGECLLCGCVPLNDQEPNTPPLPMVWAEGMDVNWGQMVYICTECAGVIADLFGRVSPEEHDALDRAQSELAKKYIELEKKYEKMRERLHKILEGRKAQKEELAA